MINNRPHASPQATSPLQVFSVGERDEGSEEQGAMLFEDGIGMLFEDGTLMLYEV